jgi:hypothetical protein
VLLERYASRDALVAHRATPHLQEIVIERLVPLLADRTIDECDVVLTQDDRDDHLHASGQGRKGGLLAQAPHHKKGAV